jgi:hypothetical protein
MEQIKLNQKHLNLLFWDLKYVVCKRYKKVPAFVINTLRLLGKL